MGQEWIVYSFVARGVVILAEHTTRPSNLPSIAAQWLENLPADPHKKFTMKYDGHTFNFLVEEGYGPYVYGVVARETVGTQQILFEFLDRIRQDFKKRYGHGEGDAATAKSLSKKFGPIMKQNMQWVVDHAEEIDRVAKVKAQISEVQVIITDNVNKILERGEQIDTVVDKAEKLHDSSLEYRNRAIEIRRKMWYQNAKIKLIILGVIFLILALVIWASICNGFNCS
ncbi:vesicle-associated membrane protein 724-like [Chenopodium quinoa]|uniref:vesicle-associated membrane protein 724-like n=1 Tax=Chenopodium quinoa TaxID=63459 RepID=UPI000B77928C|nr:vesicle-associated membrane protein 724-like [Chenopodium quinoa]XP_021725462.1 vesicle-associated membrane protein 724-like [Chenopodium quinoa]